MARASGDLWLRQNLHVQLSLTALPCPALPCPELSPRSREAMVRPSEDPRLRERLYVQL